MFKVLSQPDDFNDELGIPLDQLHLGTDDISDAASGTDMRDQFDEGDYIVYDKEFIFGTKHCDHYFLQLNAFFSCSSS